MFRKGNENSFRIPGFSRAAQKSETDRLVEGAQVAQNSGRPEEAYHLYLLAYERERLAQENKPSEKALRILQEAWEVAVQLRERSFAEYVFERLEPYLDSKELQPYAQTLQEIALDKLDAAGIHPDALREMADDITNKVNELLKDGRDIENTLSELFETRKNLREEREALEKRQAERREWRERRERERRERQKLEDRNETQSEQKGFSALVGFGDIIDELKIFGIGGSNDSELQSVMQMLSSHHGVHNLSTPGSILLSTESRADASSVMNASVAEIGLPSMNIRIQPGPGGNPVLAVTVTSKRGTRPQFGRMMFESPSVLVLEDIDMWAGMLIEASSGEDEPFNSSARAAREAIGMIHAAVSNPEVVVLASFSSKETDDVEFLFELLAPMQVIEMLLPTHEQRYEIWRKMFEIHPSLRRFDIDDLVQLSNGLSRTDITRVAEETIDEAYREGLRQRTFVPVTRELLYAHLANYQPLESGEYLLLQEEVISDFRDYLRHLEDELFFDMHDEAEDSFDIKLEQVKDEKRDLSVGDNTQDSDM